MIRLANPWWLLALLMIPAWLWLQFRILRPRQIKLPFTRLGLMRQIGGTSPFWRWFYPALRAMIMLLLVIALAQPRFGSGGRDLSLKGVDIVLAVDISGSMQALDFAPKNRLGAAVEVARDFIARRPNDRFGLVAFSEYALTQSPLTFDHQAVREQLSLLRVNESASATAIGMGLATAISRLKDSTAKSKVIILITDGVSNTGVYTPQHAAQVAREFGVKVYPIGVGTNGYVNYPIEDPLFGTRYQRMLVELDMKTLDEVAAITGTGKASQAENKDELGEIMDKIDRLEKTKYTTRISYVWAERFMPFLWAAFLLLLLEILLRLLVMPVLPE